VMTSLTDIFLTFSFKPWRARRGSEDSLRAD